LSASSDRLGADAPSFASKIAAAETPRRRSQRCRGRGVHQRRVRLLHRGHVSYLDHARRLGASLVVGVNSDASARRLGKGGDRPINSLDDRIAVLALSNR
jgi:cytidyltransferase-like protein